MTLTNPVPEWNIQTILPGTYIQSVNFSRYFIPNPPFLLEDILDEPVETTYSVFENTFIVILSLGIIALILSCCIVLLSGCKPFLPAWAGAVAELIKTLKKKSFWIPLAIGSLLLSFAFVLYGANHEADMRINSGVRNADEEIEQLIEYINSLNIEIPGVVNQTVAEGVDILNDFVLDQQNMLILQLESQVRNLFSLNAVDLINTALAELDQRFPGSITRIVPPPIIFPPINLRIPVPNIDFPPVTFPNIPPNLVRLSDTLLPVMQQGVDSVFFVTGLFFAVAAALLFIPCFTCAVRVSYAYLDSHR